MIRLLGHLCVALLFVLPCSAQEPVTLRIATWNLEGNGEVDLDVIEKQFADKKGIDLWGLTEVRPSNFNRFRDAAAVGEGSSFEVVRGKTGGQIRLAIVFDKSVLEFKERKDFDDRRFSNHRQPLAVRFKGKRTGQEFWFMVNHLASGDGAANKDQAEALNEFVNDTELPIINVGDFNFRLNLETGFSRPGLKLMKDGPWFELEPVSRVSTFEGSRFENSFLDHIFIGNRDKAVGWSGQARVLKRDGDSPATAKNFVDTEDEKEEQTDHRPVDAILTFGTTPPPGGGSVDLSALKADLKKLEDIIAGMKAKIAEIEGR